jgi:hypothetical protein
MPIHIRGRQGRKIINLRKRKSSSGRRRQNGREIYDNLVEGGGKIIEADSSEWPKNVHVTGNFYRLCILISYVYVGCPPCDAYGNGTVMEFGMTNLIEQSPT